MASESFEKLKTYLRDIFQYNENDLDFGIYKILKLKRTEIENFIEGDGKDCLQTIIEETLSESQSEQKTAHYSLIKDFVTGYAGKRKQKELLEDIDSKVDEIKQLAEDENPDNLTDVLRAIDAIQSYEPDTTNEDQIYNYILNFFELYYNNGDFGYNDRSLAQFKVEYDEDYDGSDVMFHWKHKDSYYIKSANDFTNVTFEVNGKKLEYRVEGFDTTNGTAQNNNKENKLKHYKFIEIKKFKGIHQIVFKLSDKSTPKNEVYAQILSEVFGSTDSEKYLFKKDDKPIFNDLIEKYDKILNGQVQGLKSLKLDPEKYFEHLADRDEFRDLGSNKTKRVEELKKNDTANILLLLDKNLNKFYIGNDSDFFIHKDLKKFLKKEKEKFIKNVIYSNIDVLLESEKYEQTRRIARSFNKVVDKIIEFLDAIETFQRNLFTMKKKVVQTDYLISVDKIPAEFHDEILANETQVNEFKETYNINLDDRLFKLELYPTLVIDTKYFSEEFKDRLLSHSSFENIEDSITGIIINSENFQALNLLKEKYRKEIKCVYIDPPYNSKSSSIIYKNSFKHSSWASLMENRIIASAELLKEDGVFIVAIDENEQERLGLLLSEIFNEHIKTCVTIIHNPSGQQGDNFSYTSDYAYFVYTSNGRQIDEEIREDEEADIRNFRDVTGDESLRESAKNCFYPIYVKDDKIVGIGDVCDDSYHPESPNVNEDNGIVAIYPIDPQGIERKWRFARQTVEEILNELTVHKIRGRDVLDIKRRKSNFNYKTVWTDSKYSANNHGTQLLNNILGKNPFSYPKSLYTVKDCLLAGLNTRTDSYILDYFAGSGTTGDATIRLNKDPNTSGTRKFILIEMGEYFDSVLKERIKRVLFSENWKEGKPKLKEIDGYIGIVKYQRIEQYEDVLNNLKSDDESLPKNTPLKYLFRMQEKAVRSTLDLSKPFENKINYGKNNTEDFVDLCETYIYLKGYKVNSIKTYTHSRRKYKVYHTLNRLVIWRNIKEDDDDSEIIKELIAKYESITSIDVNYHLDKRKIKTPKPYIITNADFDVNANWS